MAELLERVKLNLLVNGNGIVENFKNNSLFFYEKYNQSTPDVLAISTTDIYPGGFYFFHYLDDSNWMKYSPVFVCDFKQHQNYMITYGLNFNFIPLRVRSSIFEKFISEKDFEQNRTLAVDFKGIYNELRKYGFEYAIVEYNSINLKLVHRINLDILPRFLYSAHPKNKYDPSKLYEIWSVKIKTRDKRHQEIILSTLDEFLDIKNEISEKYEVLRGHIKKLRDSL